MSQQPPPTTHQSTAAAASLSSPSSSSLSTSSATASCSSASSGAAAAISQGQPQTLPPLPSPLQLSSIGGAAAADVGQMATAAADGGQCGSPTTAANRGHPATMLASATAARHPPALSSTGQHHQQADAAHSKMPCADPVKREETPFSLKHFLKRNPSSTTAPPVAQPYNNTANSTSNNQPLATSTSTSATATETACSASSASASSAASTPRSTGTRPKVPLNSASAYNFHTTAATGATVPNSSSYETTYSAAGGSHSARMKRSPKFSSFDSQASLAEFATSSPSSTSLPAQTTGCSRASSSRGHAAAGSGLGQSGYGQQQQQHPQQHLQFHQPGQSRSAFAPPLSRRRADGAVADVDDDDDDNDASRSPSGGGSSVGGTVFQRSFSTFDIGGGGRRYNIGQPARHGIGFARATSMQTHQQIIDDDDDDDDDEEEDDVLNLRAMGVSDVTHAEFLDSPTRRALRAATIAAGGGGGGSGGLGLGPLSPDISAALPDFVQDHILVEHLYGGGGSGAVGSAGGGGGGGSGGSGSGSRHQQQLPDFAQNAPTAGAASADVSPAAGRGSSAAAAARGSATGNMPFDLMCSPGGGCEAAAAAAASQQRRRQPPNLPLDIPSMGGRQRSAIYHDIPLDLTSSRNDHHHQHHHGSNGSNGNNGDNGGSGLFAELQANSLRRLPDFLADGHMHASAATSQNANSASSGTAAAASVAAAAAANVEPSTRADGGGGQSANIVGAARGGDSSPSSVADALRAQNARLRQELQHTQQTLYSQQRVCDELRTAAVEQASRTQREQQATLQQRESGLAELAADTRTAALQRQVHELTEQIEALRKENAILKEEGAVGGSATHTNASQPPSSLVIRQSQELSRDMLMAAASAESNLRQLLSGVDNLRLMARRIESLADAEASATTSPSSGAGAAGYDD